VLICEIGSEREDEIVMVSLPLCRMASQPSANNARPPTVQIRGQPVGQKGGCCSS